MDFTGERYLPEVGGVIHAEHVHRYRLARSLAVGKDVLDVASGEGYGSCTLAEVARSVKGVDVSSEAVAHARAAYSRANLEFVQGDCAKLPFADAVFDVVVSFETIEHHDRHEEMLREIRRVLRPGGILMISSPNRPAYGQTLSEPNPYHVKELDLTEFDSLLRAFFPAVTVYAQRVMDGSLIAPLSGPADAYRHFSDEGDAREIPDPIYFVALASDGPLPGLGVSLFELAAQTQAIKSPTVAEMRLYISERESGKVTSYSEARGAALLYSVDSRRRTLRIDLPKDVKPLARLRLDPANQPAAIALHAFSLEDADGAPIWRWDGGRDFAGPMSGLAFRDWPDGMMMVCYDNDPQFELLIPDVVLGQVGPGASFVLDMTPLPLLDVLPDLLAEPDRSHSQPLSLPALPAGAALAPVGLTRELVEVGQLMKTQIQRRNDTISRQRGELEVVQARQKALEAQVLRAEAQLEVLKEFVLSAFGRTNERV